MLINLLFRIHASYRRRLLRKERKIMHKLCPTSEILILMYGTLCAEQAEAHLFGLGTTLGEVSISLGEDGKYSIAVTDQRCMDEMFESDDDSV